MHSRLHLGEADRSSIQAQGYRGRGCMQGEEAVEGKLLRMRGKIGGVVLNRSHGEAVCQKCTADKGGVNLGGGDSILCGVLPPGAEDGEMSGDRLDGSRV